MPLPDQDQPTQRGCRTLVACCADLKRGERALVISDRTTRPVGALIDAAAREVTSRVDHWVIPEFRVHGQEPPVGVLREMMESDVIFAVTAMSMAHSKASRRARQRGARYLSLPDCSLESLASPALDTDFRALTGEAERLARILTAANDVAVRTALGADLHLDVRGRTATAAPGWCWAPGTLASPPDAETNVAPREDASQGILVVDGSIPCPQIGLLAEPLTLTIDAGRVVTVSGKQAPILESILDDAASDAARVVAEIGIGLNPRAKLCGSMLQDEGCRGTVHVGIGANRAIGGENDVAFHLDHVVRRATVIVDGKVIIREGKMPMEGLEDQRRRMVA
jgi:leucyl aminopeptidase (aminopeptidase T)